MKAQNQNETELKNLIFPIGVFDMRETKEAKRNY